MVDPITIIGTAGAAANIVDVVGKTINSLRDLHDRWRDADFTVLNLITQLTALKAALAKVQEWIDSDLTEQHHQLVMDLDMSITCCRMLIGKMDAQVSELHRTADNVLDLGSKIRVVFGNKANEDLQKVIERQISALTLLLTACNCKTISEQQILLKRSSSRKTFKRIKDDSSSLYVHRDSASFLSRCTNNSLKISMVFQFDRQLFGSSVYERALRGPLKESLRRQLADHESTKESSVFGMTRSELEERSRAINIEIDKDNRRRRTECKVLLLGIPGSGKETLMKQMKIIHRNGHSTEELHAYRDEVRRALQKTMLSVMESLRTAEAELDDEDIDHTHAILQDTVLTEIAPAAMNAMKSLWYSPKFISSFHEVVTSGSTHMPDSAEYWFKERRRIAQPDYVPTESDILRVQDGRVGIREYIFEMGSINLRVIDPETQQPKLRKTLHQFEGVMSIIFVADLSSYDEIDPLSVSSQSLLVEALELYDWVVNHRWFVRSSIILFLNNVGRFKQKLVTHPLCNYFPDFAGGSDPERATEYIFLRFNQLNREGLSVYSHFTESTDSLSNIRVMFSAIEDTIIESNL